MGAATAVHHAGRVNRRPLSRRVLKTLMRVFFARLVSDRERGGIVLFSRRRCGALRARETRHRSGAGPADLAPSWGACDGRRVSHFSCAGRRKTASVSREPLDGADFLRPLFANEIPRALSARVDRCQSAGSEPSAMGAPIRTPLGPRRRTSRRHEARFVE